MVYKYIFNDNIDMLYITVHYMALYVKNIKIKISLYNFHKLFLTTSSLAHKFWKDDCYNNHDIARVGGVTVKMLHKLEGEFLKGINWNLYITKNIK